MDPFEVKDETIELECEPQIDLYELDQSTGLIVKFEPVTEKLPVVDSMDTEMVQVAESTDTEQDMEVEETLHNLIDSIVESELCSQSELVDSENEVLSDGEDSEIEEVSDEQFSDNYVSSEGQVSQVNETVPSLTGAMKVTAAVPTILVGKPEMAVKVTAAAAPTVLVSKPEMPVKVTSAAAVPIIPVRKREMAVKVTAAVPTNLVNKAGTSFAGPVSSTVEDMDVVVISSSNYDSDSEDLDASCEDDIETPWSDSEYETRPDKSCDGSGSELSDYEGVPHNKLFPKQEMVGKTKKGTDVTTQKRLWTKELSPYGLHKCRGPPSGYIGKCDALSAESKYVDEFMNDAVKLMVKNTNKNILNNTRSREAKKRFPAITENEMYAFLGVLIAMGINYQPEISSYFCKDGGILGCGPMQRCFSRQRFMKIWTHLCYTTAFVNLHALRAAEKKDPIVKVREFLTQMNTKFRALRNPRREMVVDETMTKYKGRSSIKVKMPKKPANCGFEHFTLAESSTGYVLNDEAHCGRNVKMVFGVDEPQPKFDENNHFFARVTRYLARHYLGNWYHLVFDNRFTSTYLLELLYLHHQTTCVGTLRTNAADMPDGFKTLCKQNVKSTQRGTHVEHQNGRLVMCAWRDSTTFCVLSTGVDPTGSSEIVSRKVKNVKTDLDCPAVVNDYIKHYKGVDLANQLSSYYRVGRRCMRWHRYFFFHKLNQVLVNAYINWNEVNSKAGKQQSKAAKKKKKQRSQLKFRLEVASQLMARHVARPRRAQSRVPLPGRIHELESSGYSKRCVMCTSQGIRHESRKRCKVCQVHICDPKKRPECLENHRKAMP
jgi:hypothetical protein